MTDHLRLWRNDAQAMGIPQNIQRGLAFMVGIGLVVNGAPVEEEALPILVARLSQHLPSLPDHIGGNFFPDPIAGLLLELALQIDPGFNPRVITLPSGASFPSIRKVPGFTLPLLDPFNLANAAEVAKSLYAQIGDCIQDSDLEAALISGLKFFDGYRQVDHDNTVAMCRYALEIRPPHMVWISRCPLFELDDMPFWDITANVFDAFFLEQREEKMLCRAFYDTLRNLELIPQPEATNFENFRRICLLSAGNFVRLSDFEHLVNSCLSIIAGEDGSTFRIDLEEALQDLDVDVFNQWGYADLSVPLLELSPGEKCDRICCIVWSTLRAALRQLAIDSSER
jgi:hypothetical protein